MARMLVIFALQMDGVVGSCGFTTCKDSEVCCCNATSGQTGFCVDAGSDASVCTGSTMCPSGDSCCTASGFLAAVPAPVVPPLGEFVCAGLNYNVTCGPQYTACCGEGTIAPLCMDAVGHTCCKDEELNLAVTCAKGQQCNKGPQCTAAPSPGPFPPPLGDFVCAGLNYNVTCGPQYTACCGEGTIAPLCMDAVGHTCCKDEELNLAVTCAKGQQCNKGPQCTAAPAPAPVPPLGDFVCAGLNYNVTCGPQYTACCGEGTIAPLCMDAVGHSCCKDDELNLAVTCAKGQKCNKGPQCTAASVMV